MRFNIYISANASASGIYYSELTFPLQGERFLFCTYHMLRWWRNGRGGRERKEEGKKKNGKKYEYSPLRGRAFLRRRNPGLAPTLRSPKICGGVLKTPRQKVPFAGPLHVTTLDIWLRRTPIVFAGCDKSARVVLSFPFLYPPSITIPFPPFLEVWVSLIQLSGSFIVEWLIIIERSV